jgi:hypothetical protein
MTWEYLDEDIFQTRFGIVAAYLKGKTENKTILDLNCGKDFPILKYLSTDFRQYIGNDIAIDVGLVGNNDLLLKMDDRHILEFLKDKVKEVDILLHLGCGGHAISGESVESATDTETGGEIIRNYKPEIFILESVEKYFHHVLGQYGHVLNEESYKITHTLRLVIDEKEDFINHRVFRFFERIA